MPLARALDVGSSLLASQLRGWAGTAAFRPATRQPERPLELYEFEACPDCRLVREALTELDLDALVYPCPPGGQRFRPQAAKLAGETRLPLLLDPNTERQHNDPAAIVAYLAETYGGRAPPAGSLRRAFAAVSSGLASRARAGRGGRARPSRAPGQPLELFSFESSPYSRLVREVLSELELPYLLRQTGKGRWEDMGPPWIRTRLFPRTEIVGRNRLELHRRTGRLQVPYLVDPNTGTGMFESAAIVSYLEQTYAA